MNDLSSLLGAEMAREAAGSRDGFDPASLLEATRRGARGKRRTRATFQAFGALAVFALSGGISWLIFGGPDEPDPGVAPTPSVSPSVSPSPTTTPAPLPTAVGASYETDEYGLPAFPDADNGVLSDVGPGWALAQYWGYQTGDSATTQNGIYLVDPDGRAYLAGTIGDTTVNLWRPERNEMVHARVDGSTYVYNLVTRTDTLLDPEDRHLAFRGVIDDGRELWMVVQPDLVTAIGVLVVTPDPDVPDAYFARPDIVTSSDRIVAIDWMVVGDRLIAIPDELSSSSAGTSTVWEVSLEGVATERPLTLPDGATYCNVAMIPESSDFLWACHGAGGWGDALSSGDGSWALDLEGGPARWVPTDNSWFDHQNAIEIHLPGSNGVLWDEDATLGDRCLLWFSYEYPSDAT